MSRPTFARKGKGNSTTTFDQPLRAAARGKDFVHLLESFLPTFNEAIAIRTYNAAHIARASRSEQACGFSQVFTQSASF